MLAKTLVPDTRKNGDQITLLNNPKSHYYIEQFGNTVDIYSE